MATDKNLLGELRKAGPLIQTEVLLVSCQSWQAERAHRCLMQSLSSSSCSIISRAVTRDATLRWAGEAQETVTPAGEGGVVRVPRPCLI